MVALNTLLTVGLISFGVGVITTAILILLVVIFNKVKGLSGKKEDDEEEQGFAIPLSSLGMGGGGAGISMADIQRAAAAVRAGGGAPGVPGEPPKAAEATGNYI